MNGMEREAQFFSTKSHSKKVTRWMLNEVAVSGTHHRAVERVKFGKHFNRCNDFEIDVRDVEDDGNAKHVNLVTIFRNASLHLLHSSARNFILAQGYLQTTHCPSYGPLTTVRVPMVCSSNAPIVH